VTKAGMQRPHYTCGYDRWQMLSTDNVGLLTSLADIIVGYIDMISVYQHVSMCVIVGRHTGGKECLPIMQANNDGPYG